MEKKRFIATLEGKPYTTTDLFECMARHDGCVQVVRSDGEGAWSESRGNRAQPRTAN
jgi:hypothetical protein